MLIHAPPQCDRAPSAASHPDAPPVTDAAAVDGELELRPVAVFPWPGVVVTVALAVAATYRAAVIVRSGQPSGVDFGNWLMLGHQFLGHPIPGAAHVSYPPVVPVLSVLFMDALGVLRGPAILAGLASVAPAAGVYLACRLLGLRWPAVAPAVLLAATSSSGEAAAWGGVPQLLALGLAALSLGLAWWALTTPSWRRALALGSILLAVGATSHLVMAETVVALAFLVMIQVAVNPRRFRPSSWLARDGWLAVAGLSAAPLLALVPLYLKLLPTVGQSFAQGDTTAGLARVTAFLNALWFVYRDTPVLWIPALVLTLGTPLMLLRHRHRSDPAVQVMAALTATVLAGATVSDPNRLVYLAPLAVAMAIAVWLEAVGRRYRTRAERAPSRVLTTPAWVAAALVAMVAAASVRGLLFFPTQRHFYGAFDPPGMIAGLDWLRHNTPTTTLVAVTPIDGAPFGWWVQGYGQRAALVGSEDRWLNFPDERHRADEALALFSHPDPLAPAVFVTARALHVDYLLIPWSWGGLRLSDFRAFLHQNPAAVVYAGQGMVIVRVQN